MTRRQPRINYRRKRLELDDGDFLDLDWSGDPKKVPGIVLVLHGLEGCSRSHYVRGITAALNEAGHCVVAMHHRGCSGEPNRLTRGYHSGETGDLDYVVSFLKRDHPNVPLAVLGYSLGGNILLKWLGEDERDKPIHAAIAVSVPFELEVAAHELEIGFSKIYHRYLLQRMKASVQRKFDKRTAPVDLERLMQTKTFYDFDDLFTGPVHGFAGADDYYTRSSCRQFLSSIKRPCLIVHAEDDPFTRPEVVPSHRELSGSTVLLLSKRGGHAGFVHGSMPFTPRYWLERIIPAYLASKLTTNKIDTC